MSQPYKHLMLIIDGQSEVNELFLTETARAEALIHWMKNDSPIDELPDETEQTIREADEEAYAADYPEGTGPRPGQPEDYIDYLRDLLGSHDVDLLLDDLAAPTDTSTTPPKPTTHP